ncbi:MAG: TssQ family T6SS-associated lipoprotein [Ideonella sp.]|nr:TssQ family T6SS-associated lipoprotein [Ideonella sp.]
MQRRRTQRLARQLARPHAHPGTRLGIAAALVIALTGLGGCAVPPPSPGLTDVLERPAERALLAGMRAYDDGQYPQAERALTTALQTGLASPNDRAGAHKLLAFIYCTSNRTAECEAAFRAARAADPGFALTRSEAGHPLWGPVYKRLAP